AADSGGRAGGPEADTRAQRPGPGNAYRRRTSAAGTAPDAGAVHGVSPTGTVMGGQCPGFPGPSRAGGKHEPGGRGRPGSLGRVGLPRVLRGCTPSAPAALLAGHDTGQV